MEKKDDNNTSAPKLPEEVRSIIIRKLRHLRVEQKERWVDVAVATSSKLSEEILADINARRLAKAVSKVSVYQEIVTNAMAMTKEWPAIVWGAITSILEKAQVAVVDGQELNDIVDEHAWGIRQHPFTLAYIDAQRFHDHVQRTVGRYGLKTQSSLDHGLLLAAAAGESGVRTRARQERERIGIAIDEYVIASRQSASSAVPGRHTSSCIKREAGKLATQAMYEKWQKAYRDLLKKHPDMPDVWFSRKIAKMDIAQGRDSETIRKNMKK
ncbi:MAG: hypothetical protein ABFS18_11670 [Thermodesulfobacteriota bacterium]